MIQAGLRREASELTAAHLVHRFGLLPDDADLAIDRAMGGAIRAATGNPENCPRREKDPIAWLSYQRCRREPALLEALRPAWFPGIR